MSGSIDIVDVLDQVPRAAASASAKAKAKKGKKKKNKAKSTVETETETDVELGLITSSAELDKYSLANSLTVGSVIRVRVQSCDAKKRQLRCIPLQGDAKDSKAQAQTSDYSPGDIVLCRVREVARAPVDQALRVQVRCVALWLVN